MTADDGRSSIRVVERGLDAYVVAARRRGVKLTGITAAHLAYMAQVSSPEMWKHLQNYRRSQRRRGATRYVIACRGYSTKARWAILSQPGADAAEVRDARRRHVMWVARDAAQRCVNDGLLEVRPGLVDSRQDALIAAVQAATERVFMTQVELAGRILDGDEGTA